MEPSSSFIYQTFWKDGKHCHLLDLTWTESHSFGISAPTLPKILNGFSVLWELGGAVTVSISLTEGEMAEDVNGKPEVLLECIWMQDLPERSTPHPLCSFKTKHPELSAHTSLPLHCSPFLYLTRPHLFICPAGCATKTLSPSSKWSSNPHMLCSAHFPTPQRQSLVAKIKMSQG